MSTKSATPLDRKELPQKDRIAAIAAELFAERGYRGITNREIAAAVGLGLGTVHHHVGTKPELYQLVYRSFCEEVDSFLCKLLQQITEAPPVGEEALHKLLNEVVSETVDFLRMRPVLVRFLMRHQTECSDDFADMGPGLSRGLYDTILGFLEKAKEEGTITLKVHPSWFLRGIYLLLFGYFGLENSRNAPEDAPKDCEGLKQFLYTYICEMLDLKW
ncbi:MAG: TetR/AcrR family transcriptional regulator [Candidatus Hydrogenedentes bacterium]|nr:TetR/AcrR family transcriptional regulator [Candidatus Hydrogenedentota bacterium]